MKTLPIALQLYSVRDELSQDFENTLLKVKEIGYDFVELSSFYGQTINKILEVCNAISLRIVSAHWQDLITEAHITRAIERYLSIGCRYFIFPYLPKGFRPGEEKFPYAADKIYEACKIFKEHGADFLYHNHDFEFYRLPNGQNCLDYLYDYIPLLKGELDTGWTILAGENPIDYMEKYQQRIPIIHLKDFVRTNPNGGYRFAPVGYGEADIPAILASAVTSGVEYVVVEQDYWYERTGIECAKQSREYLKSKGW